MKLVCVGVCVAVESTGQTPFLGYGARDDFRNDAGDFRGRPSAGDFPAGGDYAADRLDGGERRALQFFDSSSSDDDDFGWARQWQRVAVSPLDLYNIARDYVGDASGQAQPRAISGDRDRETRLPAVTETETRRQLPIAPPRAADDIPRSRPRGLQAAALPTAALPTFAVPKVPTFDELLEQGQRSWDNAVEEAFTNWEALRQTEVPGLGRIFRQLPDLPAPTSARYGEPWPLVRVEDAQADGRRSAGDFGDFREVLQRRAKRSGLPIGDFGDAETAALGGMAASGGVVEWVPGAEGETPKVLVEPTAGFRLWFPVEDEPESSRNLRKRGGKRVTEQLYPQEYSRPYAPEYPRAYTPGAFVPMGFGSGMNQYQQPMYGAGASPQFYPGFPIANEPWLMGGDFGGVGTRRNAQPRRHRAMKETETPGETPMEESHQPPVMNSE